MKASYTIMYVCLATKGYSLLTVGVDRRYIVAAKIALSEYIGAG